MLLSAYSLGSCSEYDSDCSTGVFFGAWAILQKAPAGSPHTRILDHDQERLLGHELVYASPAGMLLCSLAVSPLHDGVAYYLLASVWPAGGQHDRRYQY